MSSLLIDWADFLPPLSVDGGVYRRDLDRCASVGRIAGRSAGRRGGATVMETACAEHGGRTGPTRRACRWRESRVPSGADSRPCRPPVCGPDRRPAASAAIP